MAPSLHRHAAVGSPNCLRWSLERPARSRSSRNTSQATRAAYRGDQPDGRTNRPPNQSEVSRTSSTRSKPAASASSGESLKARATAARRSRNSGKHPATRAMLCRSSPSREHVRKNHVTIPRDRIDSSPCQNSFARNSCQSSRGSSPATREPTILITASVVIGGSQAVDRARSAISPSILGASRNARSRRLCSEATSRSSSLSLFGGRASTRRPTKGNTRRTARHTAGTRSS